ncbi:MFS transporter PfmaC [Pseudocercospora fuligena]|uniref:MFS transporter PfmaC n=1 Tax=Pseudocercospora fuligena TaxID=685502 RepID=A0A8H6R9Q3_9PEZI|nr:MFS transporter PfmaC [Pseudocercospora fuligena]
MTNDKEIAQVTTTTEELNDTSTTKPTSLQERSDFFHWHEPNTSVREKKLIFKLDFFLLTFSCLTFFIKQLDSNNITNAYASGMSEELNFGPGNELSWMNTYFNIGTIVGGAFSNLAITVIRPSYWLPGCLTIWSVFVLGLYKCNTAAQFYVLRLLIGLFESAAWPGIMYVIGAWYRKSELGRRSGLFVMSGVLGQMFSGYLQAALYAGMGGKGGMSAWRWLFIFDFVIAVPVIVYGFICFPDTPHTTRAFYLNAWERERARARIEEEGRTPVGKWDWSVFYRIFGSWQVYAFTLGYSLWTLTAGSYVMQYFTLYLKATKQYSVEQINSIPTAISAVNWFVMVSTGFITDKIGRRGPVCFAVGCVLIFTYAVLAVWDVGHPFRMAVLILCGVYGCYTPILAGWVNEACRGDQQKRAFVLAFMVSVGQAVVIPFQQLQFPSSKAPHFSKTHGWGSALAFVIALTLWTGVGLPLLQRWLARGKETDSVVEDLAEA